MTQAETQRILAIITEMYPMFRNNRNPTSTAQIWSMLFKNAPYDKVENALMEFIATDTRGYPPNPGILRQLIMSIAAKDELSGPEAWNILYKAICRSSYYSNEEFKKLPPVIRDIIGHPSELRRLASSDTGYVTGIFCSRFLEAYNSRMEKDRKDALLSPGGCWGLPESMPEDND